ncbi:MAG: hypothetical protein WC707_04245 [Candidatus Babeliaceae bacterium]|jgi:hypothetical protein
MKKLLSLLLMGSMLVPHGAQAFGLNWNENGKMLTGLVVAFACGGFLVNRLDSYFSNKVIDAAVEKTKQEFAQKNAGQKGDKADVSGALGALNGSNEELRDKLASAQAKIGLMRKQIDMVIEFVNNISDGVVTGFDNNGCIKYTNVSGAPVDFTTRADDINTRLCQGRFFRQFFDDSFEKNGLTLVLNTEFNIHSESESSVSPFMVQMIDDQGVGQELSFKDGFEKCYQPIS